MSAGVIVVLNSGSSSIKFSVFSGDASLEQGAYGQIEGLRVQPHFIAKSAEGKILEDRILAQEAAAKGFEHTQALNFLFGWLEKHLSGRSIQAVGHRVVHGGLHFSAPVFVTPEVERQLEELIPLAPLHQPHNLAAITRLSEIHPTLPQVACFDTAFHRNQEHTAQLFALPRELSEKGLRRYGFHGLSYEFIASELPQYLGARAEGRIIVAHLGSGCSMCALHHRKSVESSMGFTALDGLVMGTRTGSLDPGVLLYLMKEESYDEAQLTDLLYKRSGLLGVSGISNDMRTLLESGKEEAEEAIEVFVRRAVREIGGLTAILGGLDALIFTAGIGENSWEIRQRICERLEWLGLRFDSKANQSQATQVHTSGSQVEAWVLPTNEELVIARHTLALLRTQAS